MEDRAWIELTEKVLEAAFDGLDLLSIEELKAMEQDYAQRSDKTFEDLGGKYMAFTLFIRTIRERR